MSEETALAARLRTQNLVNRLFAHEAGTSLGLGEKVPPGFRVSEKLRRSLNRLIGVAGFRAVLARSLLLARAQRPALSVVEIKPDGSLEGWNQLGQLEQGTDDGAILIAQLLTLLVSFVGEGLVMNLVHDIWPELKVMDESPLERIGQ